MHWERFGAPFFFGGSMSVSAFSFCGLGCTPCLEITLTKNGTDVHLKRHLSLLSFKFTCLHICRTCHSVSSWSLPSMSLPITNISSGMPNTLGKFFNISLILHWNISPVGAAPNGSHFYQYLPNWHVNVVRYDDLPSGLSLWYTELKSIRDKYFTLCNFGKISLRVGLLWTGLISAWFSLTRSRHSLTLPLARMHHSAISSLPRCVIISHCWSLSNSSLNSSSSAYGICLRGAWYGFLSSFCLQWKCPIKTPYTSKHIFKLLL